jgi:hypothetical protein
VQRPGGGVIRAVFQPAERGPRSQRLARLAGRLPGRVQLQRVGIVEIFVTVTQAVEALAQQRRQGVFDERRVARIGQPLRHRLGQPEPAIQLAQQRQPAVAGDVTTSQAGGDEPLFYGWKFEKPWVTNCIRRSGGFRIHSSPIGIGPKLSLRIFSVNFSE